MYANCSIFNGAPLLTRGKIINKYGLLQHRNVVNLRSLCASKLLCVVSVHIKNTSNTAACRVMTMMLLHLVYTELYVHSSPPPTEYRLPSVC